MKFCSACGNPVVHRIPEGDNLPRHICERCDIIHYQNPKLVVGCLPVWNEQILLCKRAIEPSYGLWTLPAGFMENQETLEQAALRESQEEANANLEIENIFNESLNDPNPEVSEIGRYLFPQDETSGGSR